MKTKTMKCAILGMSLMLLPIMSSYAQQTPAQNETEISERIRYSREKLNTLITKVGNQTGNGLDLLDYSTKMARFREGYLQKLAAFDSFLVNNILRRTIPGYNYTLEQLIERYNTLVKDPNSSSGQISLSIPMILDTIQERLNELTIDYQEQIMSLYEIFGDYPQSVRKGTFPNSFFYDSLYGVTYIQQKREDYQNDYGPKFDYTDQQAAFDELVIPFLAEGCRISECVTFTASDYSTFLKGLTTEIDQDFPVKLGVGTKYEKHLAIKAPHFDVQGTIQLILTTKYPKRIRDLGYESSKSKIQEGSHD